MRLSIDAAHRRAFRRWPVAVTFAVVLSAGVLRTVPIVENARLGAGDSDAAAWEYEDGSLWHAPGPEPKTGPTPAPAARLSRFPMTGMNYDMGSVIEPPPSPTPSPSPTP
jgi:hypothetical protein